MAVFRISLKSAALLLWSVLLAAAAAAGPLEDAKAAVTAKLKDPESARFSDLRLVARGTADNPGDWVCGHVNAKNSLGGYSGKKEFRYHTQTKMVSIGAGADISDDLLDGIAAAHSTVCD